MDTNKEIRTQCPECEALPGHPCEPWCTHTNAPETTRRDLHQVRRGTFAVKNCDGCHGTAINAPAPDQHCWCIRTSLDALQMRADELAESAPSAGRRCMVHALAGAMRERQFQAIALNSPRQPTDSALLVMSPFGHVLVELADLDELTVHRVDGTTWHLTTGPLTGGARELSHLLATSIPELTAGPDDHMLWTVTLIPYASSARHGGQLAITTSPCPHDGLRPLGPCCPGNAAQKYAAHMHSDGYTAALGTFPIPAGTAMPDDQLAIALERSTRRTAQLIRSGRLAITHRACVDRITDHGDEP